MQEILQRKHTSNEKIFEIFNLSNFKKSMRANENLTNT